MIWTENFQKKKKKKDKGVKVHKDLVQEVQGRSGIFYDEKALAPITAA